MRQIGNIGVIEGDIHHSNPLERVSLDELFEIAGELGDLETGGVLNKFQAELKLNFTDQDYVSLKSKKYPTLKQNIAEVIARARRFKEFYGR